MQTLEGTLDLRTALVATGSALLAALLGVAIAAPGVGLGPLAVLAGVAAVVAAAVALASPRAGLAMAVLAIGLPLHAAIFGVELRAGHLLLAFFVLGVALEVQSGRWSIPRTLGVPLLLIVFGAVLAAFAGPRTGGSLFSLADVFLLPLAAGAALAAMFQPDRDLPILVFAMAGALALAAGAGVLQASGFTPGPLEPVQEGRANGLFEHPNVLSGFVAPLTALLTGVAAVSWRHVRFAPVVLLGPILLGVAALVFTLSRGALVGLAAGIVVMMALLIVRRRVVATLAVLLLIVLALFAALPQVPQSQRAAFQERLQRLLQPGTETGRELAYTQAVAKIREYPLTGVGPLTFGRLSRESTAIGDIEAGREHAHNLAFEAYLSLGPLGLLALTWLVVSAAWRYWRATRAGPHATTLVTGWAVGGLAALTVMVVQGVGDFVFSNIEPLAVLVIVLAVAHARGLVPDRATSDRPAYSSAP